MKAYVSDMVIKVKLAEFVTLQTTGKLVGIHAPIPKEATTHLVTPDTHEPVKQFYIPESKVGQPLDANSLLTRSDCEQAVIIKDSVTDETTVTVLPKEHVTNVAVSDLPKNVMNVTVHSKRDADAAMFPMKDSQHFVFYPSTKDPDNVQNYNLLVAVLNHSNLALCSVVNIQNYEGLFRLDVWRDRLVLIKQGYPDSINPHEPPAEGELGSPIPDHVIEKIVAGFEGLAEPIDIDTYRNRVIEDKLALKSAVESGTVIEKTAPEPVKASSLDSFLAAFGD